MAYVLNKAQQELLAETKEFAQKVLLPYGKQWEHDRKLPADALEKLRQAGYFSLLFPQELGGGGRSYLETALIYEGLVHGDVGMAYFVQLANTLSYDLVMTYQAPEHMKKIFPKLISGEQFLCFAFSEPDAGTDPFNATTRFERDGEGYIIHGEKTWASNCMDADYIVTFVPDGTARGMSAFLVPKDTPGLSKEDRQRLAGNTMSCGTVTYDHVRLPQEALITENGYKNALHTIDLARLFVAALTVGIAQRAIDITVEYLGQRQTFGKPILKNQYIQFQLVELNNKVEASRALIYHCASMVDAGESLSTAAAMAKLFCPNLAFEVASECGRFFGALGTEVNNEITRLAGAARAMQIMDGTPEVQKMVLSRLLKQKMQ